MEVRTTKRFPSWWKKQISRLTFDIDIAESSIDKQLHSTFVLRDESETIVGSVRAEVGSYEFDDANEVESEDVVYIGPLAVAPSHQVSK